MRDPNKILKELVELVYIAGSVSREVACPLDDLLKRGICPTLVVDVPLASHFERAPVSVRPILIR